jgi:hypothetical protein
MITFQPADRLNGVRVGRTQAWEKRFFFIRRMALAAGSEVLQGCLHRVALLGGQAPALCSVNHYTQNAKETLNPSVAVFQHPYGIIESAIGLCANLNCHCLPRSFSSV